MPELPEVEVTKREIRPYLVGRSIATIKTTKNNYFFLSPPQQLRKALIGRQIVQLERHGKYIIALFDNDSRLLFHLGMTGQLFSSGNASVRLLSTTAKASLSPEQQIVFQPDQHTHLQLSFKDKGPDVFLRDVRKFGKLMYLAPGKTHPRLTRLGKDALLAEGSDLFEAIRKRKVAIKNLLLNQSVIAGVGNIYADEALYWARLRPTRIALRLKRDQCDAIVSSIHRVMERAIESGGSTISDFVAPSGKEGRYQDERRVYARTGLPCYQCGSKIERIILGQRSTHYCPRCQR